MDKGLNSLMAPSTLPAQSLPFNIVAVLMLLSLRSSVGLTETDLPPLHNTLDNLTSGHVVQEIEWKEVGEKIFNRIYISFIQLVIRNITFVL